MENQQTFLVQITRQDGETFCRRMGADPLALARVVTALSAEDHEKDVPDLFFSLIDREAIDGPTFGVLAALGLKQLVENPETLFFCMTDFGQEDGEED